MAKTKKSDKRYFVNDPENADRIYTEAVHGFNFTLEHDKTEEVSEAEMKLLKKASPFLTFTEVKKEAEKEDMVFGRARAARRRY